MATNRPPAGTKRPNPRADARKAAQRRQQILFVIIGVAVLALAVVIGVLSAGDSGDSAEHLSTSDVARDVEVEGETLPPLDAGEQDPTIGQPAPTLRGEDFDGTPVTVGEGDGPQLVNFMASWCPACQEELPLLTDWLNEGNLPDEVDIVSVSTSLDAGRPNWPPQDWFEEVGYPGPILVDDTSSSAAQAYGLSGTPFWVALDAEGNVVWRSSGMVPMDQLQQIAEELAAG